MTAPGHGGDAARRYKDITGGMNDAVVRMRQADAARAVELEATLADLHDAMEAAAERERLTVLGVALQWESALESLWSEEWLTLRPLPKPDPNAAPRELDYLDAVVAQRYEALREAIRRRPLLRRR
ncbi:hypothetical protein [Pseudonocardia acaciae]|uniref:hypothetical protein n=1 Tax=Pseudonocardia acaciae TaxID=551276 RepID=UPI0004909A0A|nr:hypothetical protein [Pseudonocardia acaciae]